VPTREAWRTTPPLCSVSGHRPALAGRYRHHCHRAVGDARTRELPRRV